MFSLVIYDKDGTPITYEHESLMANELRADFVGSHFVGHPLTTYLPSDKMFDWERSVGDLVAFSMIHPEYIFLLYDGETTKKHFVSSGVLESIQGQTVTTWPKPNHELFKIFT